MREGWEPYVSGKTSVRSAARTRARVISVLAAAALWAGVLLTGCSPGLLESLDRTAADPVAASPRPHSLVAEDRILVTWDADEGAEEYILERASDAPSPAFVMVYKGPGTSYAEEGLNDQGLYLYRLTKMRGARSFGPSDAALGVFSSVTRDPYEPNDEPETATELTYEIEANSYFYRSHDGQVVQDADWYSLSIPPRMKALLILSYAATNASAAYFYVYQRNLNAREIVNEQEFEISNTTYGEAVFRFKIYPCDEGFITDPSLTGGRLLDYRIWPDAFVGLGG